MNGISRPVPTPSASPRTAPAPTASAAPVKDGFREIVETVVFVIVLVLLLKTFVAEAFVIPTGSMAETLLGYQRWVKCDKCGFWYPVNCSSEVDPQNGPPVEVLGCKCPNCAYREVWKEQDQVNGRIRVEKEPPPWGSGDRVLVTKFPYDNGYLAQPHRFDVIVFKYPEGPQKATVPMNYIKRLIGLPGETIAIYQGDVYIYDEAKYGPLPYPKLDPKVVRPEDWWKLDYVNLNDSAAIDAWRAGKFKILHRRPEILLAMRRIVYDNDHQPSDLIGRLPPRWQSNAKSWVPDKPEEPKAFRQMGASGADIDWLFYQHYVVDRASNEPTPTIVNPQPELIRNVMGYNSGKSAAGEFRGNHFWVGDLMLDCTVDVEATVGELVFELSKGAERFHAVFDLAKGTVTLKRLGAAQSIADAELALGTGSHTIRFANFDKRLTLWVDGKLPFGDGVDYEMGAADEHHPNNKEPARIGARGGAKFGIRHLQLWRDTFYTQQTKFGEGEVQDGVQTRYVQPGHFLCLGDNSSESSDSRYWGVVPERLLLGRALLVYYPLTRAGVIR